MQVHPVFGMQARYHSLAIQLKMIIQKIIDLLFARQKQLIQEKRL